MTQPSHVESPSARVVGEEQNALLEGGDSASFSVMQITTGDIEEQAASLRKWDQVYEQLTPGRFVGHLREISFRGVQLFRETTNHSIHEAGLSCPGARAIGVPVGLTGCALFRGEPLHWDSIVTLSGDDELDFYVPKGFDILGLSVDERALEVYAAQIEDRDVHSLFGARRVLTPEPTRLDEFRRLLLSALQSLQLNPGVLRFHQTQRLLEQSMMGAMLALAEEREEASAPRAPCPNRRHIVEQAKAYMTRHLDETITVADLCVHLGVSRRTLQYSFRELLGINPVRFLRAMRLNQVRRDLRAAKAGALAVGDAAAKSGFWHLGHFVTDYKRMFGELPSETRCAH